MMRLLAWAAFWILVLLLGGVLAKMMLADAGVLMLTWNGWLIETTFWAGVGFLLLFVFIILICIRLWQGYAPTRLWRRFRAHRNQKAAKKETAQAVSAWLAGQDDKAITALNRVADAGGSDRLPKAITLALGWQNSDWLERQAEFVQQDPELKLFAYALGAQRLWAEQQPQQFVAHMNAHPELKQVPWLRRYLLQSLTDIKDGEAVLELAQSATNMQPDERNKWSVKGATLAIEAAHGNADAGRTIIKKVPKTVKPQADYVMAEVKFWVSVNDHDMAYKKLVSGLKSAALEALLPLFSLLQVDSNKKLALLEQYQPITPNGPYCRERGQINLTLQLWGQAQSWLEKGWAQEDFGSGVLLASLFEQRNMPEQAHDVYKALVISKTNS